ncbi:MAG: sporulation protein YqfD [Bacilli bacterium]|nr:sporulation protein YqfD [Bacilli bacterium]
MRNIIRESKIHYIWIRTETNNYSKLILKLSKTGINVHDIKYLDNCVLLKILKKDFKQVQKFLISYDFKKEKEAGIFNLKEKIKKYNRFIIAVIFGIILIIFFSNIIVKVNVIHSKKEIRELVTSELEELGIKRLTLKKNYKEIEKIKKEILEKYPDRLEWLEIEVDGMVYNVRIEERIITDTKTENKYCHVVAEKSGVIRKIVTSRGVANVNLNSYVAKGDILISGEVKLNEEIKDNVCADGKVYAEIWYTVDVSLPLDYEIVTKTGKMRYNLMYKDNVGEYIILNSRLKNKVVENQEIFSLLGRKFYLQKEYETIVTKKKYIEEEALEMALKLAREKVNVKLEETEHIIAQKVLKKSINDSKMILEVFTSVEENIGTIEEYTLENLKGE